ncbi:MAG: rhomboid family intramembrane serine protease [Planctomycetaceae bacterium]|nr:rhomboid family intramembrane serine protease [Planctomycetaceae bacterium]
MYLPLTSDAPLRYWPFATGVIIAINCVVYAIQLSLPSTYETVVLDPAEFANELGAEELIFGEHDLENEALAVRVEVPGYHPYTLSHGDGIHPIQWLTSFFMHGSLMHLLGNMLFLWIFGHMVEGAVGPWKFTALYVGMGILQGVLQQVIYLGSPSPSSLGASSAIYAIMAIAAWLCPEDQIQGIIVVFYRFFFVEVPMFIFAVFYIGFDIYSSILADLEISTPLLHALGGLIGMVVGFVLLKMEVIENEGRDLLSFSQSKGAKPKLTKRQQADREESLAIAKAEKERQQLTTLQSLKMHLKAENAPACINQWINLQRNSPEYVLEEETTLALINLMQKQQMWAELIKLGELYLQHYSTQETAIRLKLAIVMVSRMSRPAAAQRILQGLAGVKLSDPEKQQAKKIQAVAKKMLDDGVLDVSDS